MMEPKQSIKSKNLVMVNSINIRRPNVSMHGSGVISLIEKFKFFSSPYLVAFPNHIIIDGGFVCLRAGCVPHNSGIYG